MKEKWNHVADKPYYECTISIKMHGREKNYMIGRLVYNAFVKNIDFENDRLMVMHKDEDGRNNHYKNLVAGPRSAVTQRSYDANRHISPFALKSKTELKKISSMAGKSRQKPVIQFSIKGKRIKRFDSIKAASIHTGIPGSAIVNMLKGNNYTAGGYLWEYEKS